MWIWLAYCSVASIALWAAVRSPFYAVVVVYCLFAFEQWAQSKIAILSQHSWITNVVAGVIVLSAFFAFIARHGTTRIRFSRGGKLLLLLMAYAFASVLWTPDTDQVFQLWLDQAPYLIIAMLITPLLVTEAEDLNAAYRKFIYVGTCISALLLLTTDWEFRHVVLATDSGRLVGNPLETATLAGTVLIVTAVGQFGRARFSLATLFRWMAIVIALTVIIKSGSRGQLIAAVVAFALVAPFRYRITKPTHLAYLLVLVTVGALVGIYALEEFWQESDRWTEERMGSDLAGRIDQAVRLLHAWYTSPGTLLFGLGNSASYDTDLIGFYVHNVPVEILAEEGLLGASIFVWFLVWTMKRTRQTLKYALVEGTERNVVLISLGLFAYFLVLSLKQGSLLGSHLLLMSAMIFANCIARARNPRHEPKPFSRDYSAKRRDEPRVLQERSSAASGWPRKGSASPKHQTYSRLKYPYRTSNGQ